MRTKQTAKQRAASKHNLNKGQLKTAERSIARILDSGDTRLEDEVVKCLKVAFWACEKAYDIWQRGELCDSQKTS